MIFIIGRCIRSIVHSDLCYNCYNSIIKNYSGEKKIVIVDDNSSLEDPHQNKYNDVTFYNNEFKGSGEMGLYYYFNKYCTERNINEEKGIILHDSMLVMRDFRNICESYIGNPVVFLWFFPNKIFDERNKILSIVSKMKKSVEIMRFYDSPYWLGCFGVLSLINLTFLRKLDEEFSFLSLIREIDCRDKRCQLERIFAVICYMSIGIIPNICGNIFNHPRAFLSSEGYDISSNNYFQKLNVPFMKIWMGR